MSDTVRETHGTKVLWYPPDGPELGSEGDAVELLNACFNERVDLVAVPVSRLSDDFFRLETRKAGEFLGKLTTYHQPVAIVGDIAAHLAASSALRAFVRESNRGRGVWFVPDAAALDEKLAGVTPPRAS